MYLTTVNAQEYLGKILDSTNKMFHHYPLQVTQSQSGTYYYKDRHDVCMEVPELTDKFNTVYFNIVDGVKEGLNA